MKNPNKAVSAKPYGIIISYTDTHKHFKVDYEPSILTSQQLYGNQSIAKNNHSFSKQQLLLDQAMFGLNIYSRKKLETMSQTKKQGIKILYTKAQKVINRLKNERMQAKLNGILTEIFYKSSFARDLAAFEADEELHLENTMSLHDLSITPSMVADRLVKAGVFPPNYNEL